MPRGMVEKKPENVKLRADEQELVVEAWWSETSGPITAKFP